MSPAVSVIIPSFNAELYIAEAIDSVIKQTFTDWELIVVDDGSTDRTVDAIQPFLEDPRIRLLRKANGGVASARNLGIFNSNGMFVALLDADDRWLPAKLEKQISVMRHFPEVGVCGTGCLIISADGCILRKGTCEAFHGIALPRLLYASMANMTTAMIRRDVFEEVGLFDETLQFAEDYEFWLRVGVHCTVHMISEPLACYRRGHASRSSRGQAECRALVWHHILPRFLNEQGGRQFVKPWHLWKLKARGYKSRGDESHNWFASLGWYLRSIATYPFDIEVYCALGSTVVPPMLWRLVRKLKHRGKQSP